MESGYIDSKFYYQLQKADLLYSSEKPLHMLWEVDIPSVISEAVTKVIDMLTQDDFHGAFQKLLERYIKCIAAGGDYFELTQYQFYFLVDN